MLALRFALPFALLLLPGASLATNISAESDAFVFSAFLSVGGDTIVDVDSFGTASGTAPGPYADAAAPIGFSDTFSVPVLVGSIDIGISIAALGASATSDVDGAAGLRTTDAAAGGIGASTLSIVLDPLFGPDVSLLSLSLDALTADADVSGDFGALTAMGDSSITGGVINGTPFAVDPLPNSVVFDLLGITLTLNEQIEICGPSECSIEVNALHLEIDANLGGESIAGDIILAHAAAAQNAIPEPSVLLLLGVAGLAAARRRGH